MKKQDLIDLRDNNLADDCPASPSTPERDPICDRNVFNGLINTIFPNVIKETGVSPDNTITMKSSLAGLTYNFYFRKVGNVVQFNGDIKFTSGTTVNNELVFTIVNDEFKPRTGFNQSVYGYKESLNKDILKLLFFHSNNEVRVRHAVGTLEIGIAYQFNCFYYVNDL